MSGGNQYLFCEEGLFIHATTDEPVVNLTTFNPFNSTAFDFYISSQESLTRMDQLFNFCVNANGVANYVLEVSITQLEKKHG